MHWTLENHFLRNSFLLFIVMKGIWNRDNPEFMHTSCSVSKVYVCSDGMGCAFMADLAP